MSLFDLIGGTSKFKKGMEAGAKPFEAKFAQFGEAFKRLENYFGSQWNSQKEVADKILNSIEAAERERLYGLYAQTDIKQLKSEYKEILIAALYTLSTESSNEFQQSYIRSVQKYLEIKNPQTSIDFAGIENIDSQIAQKAIFQSCVEYLLLGDDGPAFFKEYGENLFSLFVIKEKDMEQIWDNVLQIYSATGPFGLAEKYGFDPKVIRKQYLLSGEAGNDEKSILEKQVIEKAMLIKSDQEMTIEGKEITLNEDIYCEGKLTLKDCILFYNGDNITGQILLLDDNSALFFNNCTIIGKNNRKRDKTSDEWGAKWLIEHKEGEKVREMLNLPPARAFEEFHPDKRCKGNPKVIVEKCLFLDCYNFDRVDNSIFKDSIIRYSKVPLFDDKSPKENGIHFIKGGEAVLEGCIFEGDETAMVSYSGKPLIESGVRSIKNCTFVNISKLCDITGDSVLQNSKFSNCSNIFNYCYNITDCVFENCNNIVNESARSVLNCQFLNCGKLILKHPSSVSHCAFINIQNPSPEDFKPRITYEWGQMSGSNNSGWGIWIFGGRNTISHCTFDGINHEGFIRHIFDKGMQTFKKFVVYQISDCEFKHCVAGIIDKKDYYYKDRHMDSDVTISISNCTGLEGTGGGQAENPVIRQTTDSGEPIGASIEESDVGVPIYQTA